jgi:hypothetical protein
VPSTKIDQEVKVLWGGGRTDPSQRQGDDRQRLIEVRDRTAQLRLVRIQELCRARDRDARIPQQRAYGVSSVATVAGVTFKLFINESAEAR